MEAVLNLDNPFIDLCDALNELYGPTKERDVQIYLRLNGLDGGPSESLRKTAQRYDLSAERVRQIADRIGATDFARLANSATFKQLEAAIDLGIARIASTVPQADPELSEAMISEGLLPAACLASSLVRIADRVGRNKGVVVEEWNGLTALTHVYAPNCFSSLLTHTKKVAGASGAFSPEVICESFARAKLIDISKRDVEAMISPFAERIDLDLSSASWYFFPNAASDLLVRARNRVGSFGWCSVSQLASIDSSKTRSLYGFKVPASVLAYVLQRSGFKVDGDRATLGGDSQVGKRMRLSAIQTRMVDILRNVGGSAKQTDYVRACEEAGIKAATARIYLYRSGIFRCNGGVCELAP